jgi:cytochrome c oxidase cbb3-type subunit 3/ubiquinol-cytochrome c reductase cytochrome c subunit
VVLAGAATCAVAVLIVGVSILAVPGGGDDPTRNDAPRNDATRNDATRNGTPRTDATRNDADGNKSNAKPPSKEGRALYAKRCALCHGDNGEGYKADHANALTNKNFLKLASDRFLRVSIAEGRPDTPMPAWRHKRGGPLSDPEIATLVEYIRAVGQQDAVALSPETVVGDPQAAMTSYGENCARCHGDEGQGKIAVSLNNPRFLESVPDDYLRQSIRDGRPGTEMAAFGGQLSKSTIDDLVALIRSWEKPTAPVFEVTEKLQAKFDNIVINPDGEPPSFPLREGLYAAAADVHAAMKSGKRMIIVDARPPSDWLTEHVVGAITIPFYSVEYDADELPNDGTWIVAYCRCPHASSGTVIKELRRRGFKNTAIIDEGFAHWLDRKYPTRKGYEP